MQLVAIEILSVSGRHADAEGRRQQCEHSPLSAQRVTAASASDSLPPRCAALRLADLDIFAEQFEQQPLQHSLEHGDAAGREEEGRRTDAPLLAVCRTDWTRYVRVSGARGRRWQSDALRCAAAWSVAVRLSRCATVRLLRRGVCVAVRVAAHDTNSV